MMANNHNGLLPRLHNILCKYAAKVDLTISADSTKNRGTATLFYVRADVPGVGGFLAADAEGENLKLAIDDVVKQLEADL